MARVIIKNKIGNIKTKSHVHQGLEREQSLSLSLSFCPPMIGSLCDWDAAREV